MAGQEHSPELAQVLGGLARNRTPGWNFPGNFLDISFDALGEGTASLSLEAGPHCARADGDAHLAAIGVLADVALAAAMRPAVGLATRMATVSMALTFTGAPARGAIRADTRFDGFVGGVAGQQGASRGELHAAGRLVCSASASFVALGNREGTAPMAMRPRRPAGQAPLLDASDLTDDEQPIYARALEALQRPGPGAFIERFWGLLPEPVEGGARCEFANSPHVGNRVGHMQGGLGWALAATTACAALGAGWRLVGSTAWYLSPGRGERLTATARILQSGGLVAIVGSRITGPAGEAVMEAVSQHARAG